MKDNLVKLVATGIYSGFMKPYPGTWGTMPAWLIAYFLIGDNTPALIGITIVSIIVSVWAASEAEKVFGHDARKIVIDEWAGMFISLLFLPYTLSVYVLAFLAFRFFDVVKLPPAAQAERLPRGWGVTMDDVVAGIYANLAVRLVLFASEKFFEYDLRELWT
jgi:phosphatidylglycerophosphatase A